MGKSEINPKDMMIGINNVGEGWHQIVRDLEKVLEALDPDYTLQQVKEKFGGLRYYAQTKSTDSEVFGAFHGAISAAEEDSYKTCEICGSKDDVTTSGRWLKTFCRTHHAQRAVVWDA